MGISDISAEVHGSTHPMNVLHAFMKVLRRQKTPEEVARETGMQVMDIQRVYEFGCSTSK